VAAIVESDAVQWLAYDPVPASGRC